MILVQTELCESGSPVDVAKLYMQARPPWASPSITHVGCTSPSPTGLKLFMEETLLIGGNLMSSSKVFLEFSCSFIYFGKLM